MICVPKESHSDERMFQQFVFILLINFKYLKSRTNTLCLQVLRLVFANTIDISFNYTFFSPLYMHYRNMEVTWTNQINWSDKEV